MEEGGAIEREKGVLLKVRAGESERGREGRKEMEGKKVAKDRERRHWGGVGERLRLILRSGKHHITTYFCFILFYFYILA